MIIRGTRGFFFENKNLKLSKTLKFLLFFVQAQFEIAIKIIRSDNDTKFFMTNSFVNKGIVHQTSCVNTPQQKIA